MSQNVASATNFWLFRLPELHPAHQFHRREDEREYAKDAKYGPQPRREYDDDTRVPAILSVSLGPSSPVQMPRAQNGADKADGAKAADQKAEHADDRNA